MMSQVDLMVPTFNNESTVGETLDSLLNQTHKNCRIVVFDNQSTDGTVAQIQPYLDRGVELIVNETNLGGEGNFNHCIERAEAPYFCICHSDDIYDSQFVEAQLKALESVPEATSSFCHAERIDHKGEYLGERFLPEELDDQWRNTLTFSDVLHLSIKYGNVFTCPSAFFKTSVFKENDLKFEGHKYKSSSDLGLWLNLSRLGPVLFHTAPLLRYRESDVSFSFALKKARTHRHDLFLVLDDFVSQCHEDLDANFPRWRKYVQFLEFKDQMFRCFNVIKTKKWSEWPEQNYHLTSVLSVLFSTAWHLRFGIKALIIWVPATAMKKINT